MKKLLLIALLAFASLANAQYNPQIFTSLYTGSDPLRGVNNLYFSTQMNDMLFFNVWDDTDTKLYVTDGTVPGTVLLKSVPQVLNFGVFENNVYFSYVDAANGVEVWKTNGTVAGTIRVAILGGNASSGVYYTVAANRLYYASGNAASPFSKQLYAIEAGTDTPVLLDPTLYEVEGLTLFNDRVIFSASDTPDLNNPNRELYITDCIDGPVMTATCLLKDINPGAQGSNPRGFFEAYGKLYFSANNGANGNEVWYTDGTESGTQLLKDINPGSADAMYSLSAGKTDGILLFTADDGVNGREVWYSYGTAANTALMLDINPSGDANPSGFVSLETRVVFTANNGTNGSELWVTNGEASQTNLVADINVGPDSASYAVLKNNALCDRKLFFDADNGNNNVEPWVTDGVIVRQVADLNPTGSSLDYETNYKRFKDRVYFAARTGTRSELFVMDEDCSLLSVADNNSIEFKVYPNPASTLINIETTAVISKIEVYNNLGQLVLSANGNNKNINVSELNTGMYFMKIIGEGTSVSVQKILIK